MRLDKFLKVSRLIKRRSVGKDLIEASRVYVNNKQVKPSYNLKVDDVITIELGNKLIRVLIKEIKDFANKLEAEQMYEILEETFIEK